MLMKRSLRNIEQEMEKLDQNLGDSPVLDSDDENLSSEEEF